MIRIRACRDGRTGAQRLQSFREGRSGGSVEDPAAVESQLGGSPEAA